MRLDIFDLLGRRVARVIEGQLQAGLHEVRWDGSDRAGRQLPSGVYFFRLKNGTATATRKLTIIR